MSLLLVPVVPQDTDANHTLASQFESSGFTLLDLIHDLERNYGIRFYSYNTPMDPTYFSVSDSTKFCKESKASLFCKVLHVLQAIVEGGRLNIQTTVADLSHYLQHPQEGQFLALKRILGYVKYNALGCGFSRRNYCDIF